MSIEAYITIREAPLYRVTGRLDGQVLPEGLEITANWLWDSGDLKGMRKIETPLAYADLYIKDDDIIPYIPPTPEPPNSNKTYTIDVFEDGTVILYDANGEIVWQSAAG